MLALIIRRLLQSVMVMLTVALIAFIMFRFVGDPIAQMVGQDTPIADREAMREQLGLNDPAPIQFARFVFNVVQGNFGISYQKGVPVDELILSRLPATLELSFVAALFALVVAIPMGIYTGLYPRRWLSNVFLTVSLLGISLPTFLIGILLILFFGVMLGWLPTYGRGEIVDLGAWTTGLLTESGIRSLLMPAFTLGLFQLTLIMRLVRSEMLEVMRTDYIKFARARGLSNRAVHFGHALKNTLVPVITITGLQLGSIIAFSIITETVFQWPGMGLLIVQAIQFVDIPVMSTYLIVIAFFFVIINMIVDILYHVVDPRLRAETGGKGH
ncbi:ABC transporter permease [Oceanibacterium hippocampi]|uniref:Glutathione transport system permease protein GsiC n=1 Tax=Oceanibacterium hippocampi TaxID=745714 RepID=A0A1Y5SF33_9PROT|nr:ABC transporter permease [Oceanibacterium hippocampi]SLN38557.1 Glutathione transport system permease protein GsiC [Oceanibacterium hippocampi]